MSQRLLYITKWIWCLLVVHADSVWSQPRPITVRTPPSHPSTIEAQAKFFQYRHLPNEEEFNQGHRLGSERHFTERHERARPSEGLFSAKVRWGDKKGGYGEHYWDLNHAGNSGNHGDDSHDGEDGSYHDTSNNDHYDGSNDHSPSYDHDDYDPEKSSSYDESGRSKRHHPKVKLSRKHQKQTEIYEEESKPKKDKRKNKEELEAAATHQDDEYVDDDEEYYEKPKRKHYKEQEENQHQYKKQEQNEPTPQAKSPKEKNQYVLVVSHKDDEEKQKQQHKPQYSARQEQQYLPRQPELNQYLPKKQPEHQYVPYEGGAGVRQHQPDVSAATTVPRLFLEPSTGHVVDRTTGQAYVLQPIATPNNY